MADVKGTDKVGLVAAALMDAIDAHLAECGGEVIQVAICAEIDRNDGEDVYVQMITKSTTNSPVYTRGLFNDAAGVIGAGTFASDDGSGEVE